MKATVEITIRMLLEADKTVDKKCIDRGIAVLKGGDVYLPEVVTIAEAMKATRRSIRWLHFGGIVATRMHDTDSWLQHCAWKRELQRDSFLKLDFSRPWREKADWEL